ncbi:MAG: HD domain-containing protein [Anaerolineae bacterium]|nr:HD domain-containing protein [Anaerolineae bacterium]
MEQNPALSQKQESAYQAVLELATTCNYNPEHIQRVVKFSLKLFDELKILHRLGEDERFWLQCAATLHDIGQIEGHKQHHKASLKIIITNSLLPFDNKERLIIASIARYHRKALPSESHDHYAALDPQDREKVCVLAACLRLADGLDQSSQGQIVDLSCKPKLKKITIVLTVKTIPRDDHIAVEKSDLMQVVFNRKIILHWEKAN